MKTKINHKIKLYCEKCKQETEHEPKTNIVKSFMDGAFMFMTKGWSLMHETQLFECCDCGNIVEVEVEE